MRNPQTGEITDAFKIHNSWGESWVRQTNGGWFLADNIISRMDKNSASGTSNISYVHGNKALTEQWIENTPDYQRAYKGQFTGQRARMGSSYVGETAGVNQKDAAPLLEVIKNTHLTFKEYAAFMQQYFVPLGYTLKSQDEAAKRIYFDRFTVWYSKYTARNRLIIFDTRANLEEFKSKLDFRKIKGEFEQGAASDNGYLLQFRGDD